MLAEILAAVALGDPDEQLQGAFGVGRGGAAHEESVQPLPRQPEDTGEVCFGAAFPEQRHCDADEAVPQRGVAARAEGAVVAGDVGFAAADGFPGWRAGGIPERLDEAEQRGVIGGRWCKRHGERICRSGPETSGPCGM